MHGRKKVMERVVGSVDRGLAEQIIVMSGVMGYWRDEAAHGTESSISEVQAQSSLAQLLRLAQIVSDNWQRLTQ